MKEQYQENRESAKRIQFGHVSAEDRLRERHRVPCMACR
jgi:hypothetical protein